MSFMAGDRYRDKSARAQRRRGARSGLRNVEVLEGRELLATFAVTSLGASGPGTLRQAILDANRHRGADTIRFDVAGTIATGRASLPTVNGTLTIDGASAPGFHGTPVVTVDFQRSHGLRFGFGADGSVLRSLSVVNAGTSGVILRASHVTVEGNYIGVLADGTTAAGNRGDGIQISPLSHGNVIGNTDPVTKIDYFPSDAVSQQIGGPVSGWQGIRQGSAPGEYLITGTSNSNGLLYVGPISGVGGKGYLVNYPPASSTSIYGPNLISPGHIQLIGTYRTSGSDVVNGLFYDGPLTDDGFANTDNYQTIDYPGAQYTYMHSTMGGLAVGNADGPEGNAPIGTGTAFIYDTKSETILPQTIVFPGSITTTAYGIWYNGGTSYTIVGGYMNTPGPALAHGYIVDFDSATGKFTHWTSLDYPGGVDIATHFEGISSYENGVYTLAATSFQIGDQNAETASWASLVRNADGSFGPATWVPLQFPGTPSFLTNDSVAGNASVGIGIGQDGAFAYQSIINTGFQLSNVISANGGNGIGVYGSSDNVIAMNNIGTNAAGTGALGNRLNGIRLTLGARRNLIGGEATGGNDPTGGTFVRPPQGNLISGNGANGVLMDLGATHNQLSGNFIGTTASGGAALGNRLDGVAMDHANGNTLLGCNFSQNPFVFYNVISGNGGNGVRVTDSNDVTIQANFLGVGADNATVVGNGGDGLLVSGRSKNTQVGGVIPLGNVISGNNRNGIEVKDKVSGFVSFNTFGGVFAFGGAAPNQGDGILVTSTGGNNLIRTSIISGNMGNGIEITGNATGVQVTDTATGTDTAINSPIPNALSGIKIGGKAHGNAIGGFQPSVEPDVTSSSNGRYGIEIVDQAHDNFVFHTTVGSSAMGTKNLGNTLDGIFIGPGTSSNTIGGATGPFQNTIVYNGGRGVVIKSSQNNKVLGNQIQYNVLGGVALDGGTGNLIGDANEGNLIASNGGDGVTVSGDVSGSQVLGNAIQRNGANGLTINAALGLGVGGTLSGTGNQILANAGFGVFAEGICDGTVVQHNTIQDNSKGNVDLSNSQGITFIP